MVHNLLRRERDKDAIVVLQLYDGSAPAYEPMSLNANPPELDRNAKAPQIALL